MPAHTMTGARGKVYLSDPNSGKSYLCGTFSSISWGLVYDVQPIFLLGRYGPAELVYTAQEPVSVQCSGFKVVDSGAHVLARFTNVRDLLTHEYLQIVVNDRQTGKDIGKISGVRPVSYSTSLDARGVETINVSYMGLIASDESGDQAERPDSVVLP